MPFATTHLDVFYDEESVRQYVLQTGDSHPFNNQLYYKEGSQVKKTTVLAPSAYLSSGSLDKTTETISKIGSLSKFRHKFPFMNMYTIEMLIPGQCGSFFIEKDQPYLLWGAELKPTFFDAQLFTKNNMNCYKKQSAVPGMMHSGDLTDSGHFTHSIVCNRFVEDTYAAAAVGYNKTKLVNFQQASPFILMVDHTRQVMYAVPFSLEYATIGDSMMIAPLIFNMNKEGLVRWYIPATCPTDSEVNTGDYSQRFRSTMAHVSRNFEQDYAYHQRAMEEASAQLETETTLSAPILSTPSSNHDHKCIVFIQDGINPSVEGSHQNNRLFVNFGVSLGISEVFTPNPAVDIVLPIIAGEAHGHAALALGKKAICSTGSTFNSTSWRSKVNACSTIIHVNNGTEWSEGVLQAQLYRLVGLMIVHIPRNFSTYFHSRQSELSELKIPASRLMCGISIILIKSQENCYFYRGSIGVLPVVPSNTEHKKIEFAHEVNLEETIRMHLQRNHLLNVDSFVSQDFSKLLLSDGTLLESTSHEEIYSILIGNNDEWHNIASQLSVCLTTANIENLKQYLTTKVLQFEKEQLKLDYDKLQFLIEDLKDKFKSPPPGVDVTVHTNSTREGILAQKQEIRKKQTTFKELLSKIEQLCSFKVVSSRKVGIQQAQRKQAVKENVARANSLTPAKFAESLMDTSWGVAIARIEPTLVPRLLNAISSERTDKYLQDLCHPQVGVSVIPHDQILSQSTSSQSQSNATSVEIYNHIGFEVPSNCTMLDIESIEILLEHKQEDHILRATEKAMPLTFILNGAPHLVLPMYNDAVQLNGQYVNFMDEANKPYVANFRVILRGMLSNLKSRCPIKPQSKDLTFGIQIIVLSLMLSTIKPIKDIEVLEESSTVCQMLRSLMYLWGTFAASGQKPVTFAYQLLQPGAKIVFPKLRGEWAIYAIIAKIYPFLKLPMAPFKSNVRILLIEAIFHYFLSDKITKVNSMMKDNSKEAELKNRRNINIALRWNYAACAILSRIDKESLSKEDSAYSVKRLLELAPDKSTYTTTQLKRSLRLLSENVPLNWDLVRTVISCATIKRSGCFAQHKKKQTVTSLTKAKLHLCQQLNMKTPGDVVLASEKLEDTSLLFCGTVGDSYVYKDPNKLSTIKVQNDKAYEKGDISKMKGDAELVREAWRIKGGDIEDKLSNSDFLRQILPTIVTMSNISPQTATALLATTVPKNISENKLLSEVWDSAHSLHPDNINKMMPPSCLFTLFNAIGVPHDKQRVIIGDIIHTILLDYKHIDKAKLACAQMLKEKYDCSMASVEIQ